MGEAEELQSEAVLGLDSEVGGAFPKGVLRGPGSRVSMPGDGKVLEDEGGPRKMAGRTYHFGACPLMCCHDAGAVKDILNGVLRLVFFYERRLVGRPVRRRAQP